MEEEWPSLGGPTTTQGPSTSPSPPPPTEETEDWEMLQQKDTDVSFELLDEPEKTRAPSPERNNKPINRKFLRHCESSPSLSGLDKIVEQTPTPFSLDAVHEEDDSFALVSGPPSVMTATTNNTVSWACLASSRPQTPTEQKTSATTTKSEPRTRIQPKFIVVHTQPMRRCSKSTGDLQSLLEEEDVGGGGGGGGGGGACDAMEFYNRKAVGAASRSNGLKLRPDEKARKQIILAKKSEQRLKQQAAAGRQSKQ